MVDVSCANCKAIFKARQADLNRGWGKFCSKSCKAKHQERITHQNSRYHARRNTNFIAGAALDNK